MSRHTALQPCLFAVAFVALASCRSAKVVDRDDVVQEGTPGGVQQPESMGEFEEFEEEFGKEFEEPEEIFDPLFGYNWLMYHFNDRFYLWLWQPVAKGYAFIVPEVARVAVNRAYKNARTPVRFANALFQLKFKKAGTEFGRLLVNSTIGIGGLFDPADAFFDWRAPSPEDFGQTLGHYGVGGGFPLVLPLLGPKNLRDALGLIPDTFMYPEVYFISALASVAISSGEHFDRSSLHIGEYESLKEHALDPYTFFRDAYEQNREKKIQE